jgi:hypothetical protein
MLIALCMSSSYSLDANASRGRARIFRALQQETRATDPHKRSTPHEPPDQADFTSPLNSPLYPNLKALLGKERTHPHQFLFPSSGSTDPSKRGSNSLSGIA